MPHFYFVHPGKKANCGCIVLMTDFSQERHYGNHARNSGDGSQDANHFRIQHFSFQLLPPSSSRRLSNPQEESNAKPPSKENAFAPLRLCVTHPQPREFNRGFQVCGAVPM
jgi:hypothetical protein